jgi:hypothetical protein
MDLLSGWCAAVIRSENEFSLSRLLDDVVLALVLIAISMSSDDVWLGPPWDESWDV